MALRLLKDRGVPIEKQVFTWKDLVQAPYSKLTDDAFTRVRVILMNGIESEALRFSHACARMNAALQAPLAQIRRIEQHQQTLVNWLNPRRPDAARDDDRLRAGRDRGDGQRGPGRAGSVSGADVPLRPAGGLRPPLSLLGPDGSHRGQRRQRARPELLRHRPRAAHRAASTGTRWTTSARPTIGDAPSRSPSSTRSPSWPASTRRTTTT